jgi:hypothetical protein
LVSSAAIDGLPRRRVGLIPGFERRDVPFPLRSIMRGKRVRGRGPATPARQPQPEQDPRARSQPNASFVHQKNRRTQRSGCLPEPQPRFTAQHGAAGRSDSTQRDAWDAQDPARAGVGGAPTSESAYTVPKPERLRVARRAKPKGTSALPSHIGWRARRSRSQTTQPADGRSIPSIPSVFYPFIGLDLGTRTSAHLLE